jgi:sugar lactone lactonase YvrE
MSVTCNLLPTLAAGHPGSGIVVDDQGQVLFVETGRIDLRIPGFIWKIDAQGQLSSAHLGGAHWLALDAKGRFTNADLRKWFNERTAPNFERVALENSKGILLQTDGVPFAIASDGCLYFAKEHKEIMRITPEGKVTSLIPDLARTAERLGGIKGLAVGPDGSLYLSYPRAMQKVTLAGKLTLLVDSLMVSGCDQDVPQGIAAPYLRGLAVDQKGTVFVAATGCRCVLRIAEDRKPETILKAEHPWSPTGVAVHNQDVYVLEYKSPNGQPAEWQPRVRRLGSDGKIATLATVPQSAK